MPVLLFYAILAEYNKRYEAYFINAHTVIRYHTFYFRTNRPLTLRLPAIPAGNPIHTAFQIGRAHV